MSKISFKHLLVVLFMVLLCQSDSIDLLPDPQVIQTDLVDTELDDELQSSFLAQASADSDVQSTELNDQLFLGGLFEKFLGGGGHKYPNPFYGGFELFRYGKTNLQHDPIYLDVDDNFIYLNQIEDQRSDFRYNLNNNNFLLGSGWGDLSRWGSHYQNIGRLFPQLSRITYGKNYFLGYNKNNRATMAFRRYNQPYVSGVSGKWRAPVYQRSYSLFPNLGPFRKCCARGK